MSWIFGVKKQPTLPEVAPDGSGAGTAGQASGDQQLTKAEKKAMEAYRFDSSALERAAQAAKTLENSSELTQVQLNDVTIWKSAFFRECQGSARVVQAARGHQVYNDNLCSPEVK